MFGQYKGNYQRLSQAFGEMVGNISSIRSTLEKKRSLWEIALRKPYVRAYWLRLKQKLNSQNLKVEELKEEVERLKQKNETILVYAN